MRRIFFTLDSPICLFRHRNYRAVFVLLWPACFLNMRRHKYGSTLEFFILGSNNTSHKLFTHDSPIGLSRPRNIAAAVYDGLGIVEVRDGTIYRTTLEQSTSIDRKQARHNFFTLAPPICLSWHGNTRRCVFFYCGLYVI